MSQIPAAFICPLSHMIIDDPVVDHEGNTYDIAYIVQWLNISKSSPITKNDLREEWLISNRALKELITEYKQK
jgi:hypothetical protein